MTDYYQPGGGKKERLQKARLRVSKPTYTNIEEDQDQNEVEYIEPSISFEEALKQQKDRNAAAAAAAESEWDGDDDDDHDTNKKEQNLSDSDADDAVGSTAASDDSVAEEEEEEEDHDDDDDDDEKDANVDFQINRKKHDSEDDEKEEEEEEDSATDSSSDDEEKEEDVYRKFNNESKQKYISNIHPESMSYNHDEVMKLCNVKKNELGEITDDPFHKTIPFLTKYEMTRILGQRTKQLNDGAKPYVKVSESVIDGYIIAQKEIETKCLPYIIRRPLPNGSSEFWRLQDLEIIN
jgi:DNA-directed RNA polymerase subunit K/omega